MARRKEGRRGSYVLEEAIPAGLERSGADRKGVAIGGISMGGFGALDLGRLVPDRFCAVGGHSPALFVRSDDISVGFDGPEDFARHDLVTLALGRSPYDVPVWLDVGDEDSLRTAVGRLAGELPDDDADVTFHVWSGGHAGPYWDRHFGSGSAAHLPFGS